MKKVLVPFDGSKPAQRALKLVIHWIAEGLPLEIVLLNVQFPLRSANIKRFIARASIDDYQREEGDSALKSGRAALDRAKISYESEIVVGHVGETIAGEARKRKCNGIVMGTRGMGTVKNLMMGSVATQVVHLAEVPVTLVK